MDVSIDTHERVKMLVDNVILGWHEGMWLWLINYEGRKNALT